MKLINNSQKNSFCHLTLSREIILANTRSLVFANERTVVQLSARIMRFAG
jgi:hypothetical protein